MKKFSFVLLVGALVVSNVYAGRGGKRYEVRKAACSGKSAGEVCSFQGRRGEKTGTCKASRRNPSEMVCKGDRKGRRGGWKKKNRQVKIQACSGKSVGDSCSFEGRRGTKEGICTQGRRDPNVLKCKRQR